MSPTSLKTPICVICGRGNKYDLAGGSETFVLIQAEIRKNGLYQGVKYHIFCGSCVKPILHLDTNLDTIDCSNLTNLIIQIEIEGKGRKQNKRIKVLH